MKVSFTTNDYLLIIGYFLAVLVIGFKTKSTTDSAKNYLLAGRTLTLPAFVATLVASFYGGILGVGEFTYKFGIAGWFLYAFPYYFFIVIFAFFLAGKIRRGRLYSIPDKLNEVYGKRVSVFGGILIFFLSTPAPYLFMMGILINLIFGFKLIYAMILSLLLSVIYLIKGGLKADVRVNIFEFVLMFVGFGIIVPFCLNQFGGFSYITLRLPAENLSFTGNSSLQYIMVWFFIGAWVLIDPVFYQRCFAAKDKKTPKRGVLLSLVFWIIFDFLTTTAGLYSKAYFLDGLQNPLYAYPALANAVLPPIAKGVFFIGMMATIMSSLHSYIFVSSTTFARDVVSRIQDKSEENIYYNRTGMLVSVVFSLLIAFLIPSVVNIWYTVGTLIIPALLISVISAYFEKLQVHSKYIFAAMISSFTVSFIFFIIGAFNKINGEPQYPFSIEPMYPGLFVGLIIYFIGQRNKKYLQTESEI
ncbi:MAG: sodium:solute symporter family protein [Bacteroidota bacterium]|nr:sodium:solute symporter family protein [Bacteroidota bacterium]